MGRGILPCGVGEIAQPSATHNANGLFTVQAKTNGKSECFLWSFVSTQSEPHTLKSLGTNLITNSLDIAFAFVNLPLAAKPV